MQEKIGLTDSFLPKINALNPQPVPKKREGFCLRLSSKQIKDAINHSQIKGSMTDSGA